MTEEKRRAAFEKIVTGVMRDVSEGWDVDIDKAVDECLKIIEPMKLALEKSAICFNPTGVGCPYRARPANEAKS